MRDSWTEQDIERLLSNERVRAAFVHLWRNPKARDVLAYQDDLMGVIIGRPLEEEDYKDGALQPFSGDLNAIGFRAAVREAARRFFRGEGHDHPDILDRVPSWKAIIAADVEAVINRRRALNHSDGLPLEDRHDPSDPAYIQRRLDWHRTLLAAKKK